MIIYKKAKASAGKREHTHKFTTKNLSCGDEVTVYLKVKDGLIEDASYEVIGCSISTSFTYLLIKKLKGMKVQDVLKIPPEGLFELIGVEPVSSQRFKCALISLISAKKALQR